MKQFFNGWLSTYQGKIGRGLPFHWRGGEIVLAIVLILGILSLGSGMVGRWIDAAGDGGILPVSLHSLSEADYSVDEIFHTVPAIGLEIIRDLLGIDKPPETGGLPEIVVIITETPTPTPTTQFIGGIPTESPEITGIATATGALGVTSTSSPPRTVTPTKLPTIDVTHTPTWTNPPPRASYTPTPTATPGKIPTNTPEPTPQPPTTEPTIAPTDTQIPSPTDPPSPTQPPPPESSPTARPTRSSTLAVTPTAKYTPGITGEPPVLP